MFYFNSTDNPNTVLTPRNYTNQGQWLIMDTWIQHRLILIFKLRNT